MIASYVCPGPVRDRHSPRRIQRSGTRTTTASGQRHGATNGPCILGLRAQLRIIGLSRRPDPKWLHMESLRSCPDPTTLVCAWRTLPRLPQNWQSGQERSKRFKTVRVSHHRIRSHFQLLQEQYDRLTSSSNAYTHIHPSCSTVDGPERTIDVSNKHEHSPTCTSLPCHRYRDII